MFMVLLLLLAMNSGSTLRMMRTSRSMGSSSDLQNSSLSSSVGCQRHWLRRLCWASKATLARSILVYPTRALLRTSTSSMSSSPIMARMARWGG